MYLVGTSDDDQIVSENLFEGDTLAGRAGNDALFGYINADILLCGLGNDYASGGAGNDFLAGHKGRDQLDGGEGWDLLFGGAGDDILWDPDGGELYGQGGNDTLYSVAKASIYNGGYRIHHLSGGVGDDLVGIVLTDDDAVVHVQLGKGKDIHAIHGSTSTTSWNEVHVEDFIPGVDKLALRFDTDTSFARFDFNQDGILSGADLPDVDNGAYVYQGSEQECLMFDIGETHVTLQSVQILRPEDFV